jgi:hypothetical protein
VEKSLRKSRDLHAFFALAFSVLTEPVLDYSAIFVLSLVLKKYISVKEKRSE